MKKKEKNLEQKKSIGNSEQDKQTLKEKKKNIPGSGTVEFLS
jgi:hypothetical protein